MTRDQQLKILQFAFEEATKHYGYNPGDRGESVREYADFVASEVRRMVALRPPTEMTLEAAHDFADRLEGGEFDVELAAMFGYA